MRFYKIVIGIFFLVFWIMGSSANASDEPSTLSGPFNNAPMKTKGMWYLDKRSDGIYLMLSEGFETMNGPNLHIYLSKQSARQVAANSNSNDLHVSRLKKYKGGQAYKLTTDLDLNTYKSIAIICDTFHKVWAAGDIHPVNGL